MYSCENMIGIYKISSSSSFLSSGFLCNNGLNIRIPSMRDLINRGCIIYSRHDFIGNSEKTGCSF